MDVHLQGEDVVDDVAAPYCTWYDLESFIHVFSFLHEDLAHGERIDTATTFSEDFDEGLE